MPNEPQKGRKRISPEAIEKIKEIILKGAAEKQREIERKARIARQREAEFQAKIRLKVKAELQTISREADSERAIKDHRRLALRIRKDLSEIPWQANRPYGERAISELQGRLAKARALLKGCPDGRIREAAEARLHLKGWEKRPGLAGVGKTAITELTARLAHKYGLNALFSLAELNPESQFYVGLRPGDFSPATPASSAQGSPTPPSLSSVLLHASPPLSPNSTGSPRTSIPSVSVALGMN